MAEPKDLTHAAGAAGAVRPLLVDAVPGGGFSLAKGVRAGNWIFGVGLMAGDAAGGVDAAVTRAGNPLAGRHRNQREARAIFDRLEGILETGGASLAEVVRLDQYYRSWKNVDPYHTVRTAAFDGHAPASTSVLQCDLPLRDADMDVQAIAVVRSEGLRIEAVHPEGVFVPAQSAHTPVVRAGDFLFMAGQLARGPDGKVPEEARVPREHRWKGTQIKAEAEYVIAQKVLPLMASVGCSRENIVKAQVYLEDIGDLPDFLEVWQHHFPEAQVALTVVPTAVPGFNTVDTHIEINVMGLADSGSTARQVFPVPDRAPFEGAPSAVRAGDLLLLSGLLAADCDGAVPGAQADPSRPWFGAPAKVQTRHIVELAHAVCAAAGTSIENVVRIQQFHTDLGELHASCEVWHEALGGRPLPLSAVGVPGPLAVPGTSILTDLWVYAP